MHALNDPMELVADQADAAKADSPCRLLLQLLRFLKHHHLFPCLSHLCTLCTSLYIVSHGSFTS